MNPWGSYNGSYSWATPSDEYNPSYPAMNLALYNPQSSGYQQQQQQGYFPNKKQQNNQKIKASPVSVKKETVTPKRVERGGKSNAGQKRHTVYQNGAWNGDWSNIRGSVGNGGGRGRGGRGRGRGGRGKFFGPTNKKTDIPFVVLEDSAPAINLTLSAENIVGFHGFDSVFTTQHTFPVLVEGQIYTSCDHYYQCKKVLNLTGNVCESLLVNVRDETGAPITTVSTAEQQKSFSQMAKEALKAANIEKSVVEKWRTTKGLAAIQTALLAKVSQSAHLREALKETADNLLVHAFRSDSIYGTGCGVPKIKQWVEDLRSSGVRQIRVPGEFPLTETSVQGCPVIAEGRNILGVILMLLREKIRKNEIEVVDMTELFNKLRTNPIDEKMEVTGNEPITL